MTNKIDGVGFQLELVEHLFGRLSDLNTFMSLRIVRLEVLHESKEFFASTLFEETHQIRFKSFAIGCGHFLNFITTLAEEALLLGLKDVRAVNALPLEVL